MESVEKKEEAQLVDKVEIVENHTSKGLNDKYVFMEDTFKVLEISLISGKNVILYGKGGHGKSEASIDFFREKGIEPFVITMGSGTTVDRLFGGIDLKTFETTGKIEYLLDNSFMNFEYVIFEELFDAPDYILEQLKDILSAKCYRNGTQVYPIKTKLIVCCTNKTRDQFSKNDSLKALMERFPLEQEVKWKDYNVTTYEKLLNTVNGYADPMLTYILQEYAKSGILISPRIAIAAADLLHKFGPDSLMFLADFKSKNSILTDSIKKFKSIFEIKEIAQKLQLLSERYDKEVKTMLTDSDNIGNTAYKIKEISTEAGKLISKIKSIKTDDSLAPETAGIIAKYTQTVKDWEKDAVTLVSLAKLENELAE